MDNRWICNLDIILEGEKIAVVFKLEEIEGEYNNNFKQKNHGKPSTTYIWEKLIKDSKNGILIINNNVIIVNKILAMKVITIDKAYICPECGTWNSEGYINCKICNCNDHDKYKK